MRNRWLWFLAPGVLACGCMNAASSTDVKSDGSATYTVVLTVPDSSQGSLSGNTLPIDQLFQLPKAPAWKTQQTVDKNKNVVFTATRNLTPATQTDAGVTLLEKGKPATKATIRVEKLPDANVKYTAIFESLAAKKDPLGEDQAKINQDLSKLLPPGAATEAETMEISRLVARDVWKALFGPGDPLLAQALANSAIMERKLKSRVAGSIRRALATVLGDKLTEAQRNQIVQKALASDSMGASNMADPASKQGESDPSQGGFASMVFAVKLPGKVIQHNGAIDELTGEIYWDMFSPAADIGPVTMTAICQP